MRHSFRTAELRAEASKWSGQSRGAPERSQHVVISSRRHRLSAWEVSGGCEAKRHRSYLDGDAFGPTKRFNDGGKGQLAACCAVLAEHLPQRLVLRPLRQRRFEGEVLGNCLPSTRAVFMPLVMLAGGGKCIPSWRRGTILWVRVTVAIRPFVSWPEAVHGEILSTNEVYLISHAATSYLCEPCSIQ